MSTRWAYTHLPACQACVSLDLPSRTLLLSLSRPTNRHVLSPAPLPVTEQLYGRAVVSSPAIGTPEFPLPYQQSHLKELTVRPGVGMGGEDSFHLPW